MKQQKTLYLIDDDNDDLDFFCEAVSAIDQDIACVRFTNSDKALKAFQSYEVSSPDLIFLDLNMPLVDGREFLSRIKALEAYAHVPVIIYTTSSHQRDIEETKQLGASAFLSKPYSMSDLINELGGILQNGFEQVPSGLATR